MTPSLGEQKNFFCWLLQKHIYEKTNKKHDRVQNLLFFDRLLFRSSFQVNKPIPNVYIQNYFCPTDYIVGIVKSIVNRFIYREGWNWSSDLSWYFDGIFDCLDNAQLNSVD